MAEPDVKTRLLEAAKPHVPFDGWSEAAFRAAMHDTGIDEGLARATCPRGALDLALAFHEAGDRAMLDRLAAEDSGALRFPDRIVAAVRFRLEAIEDRELIRRGTTLFALPQYAPEGAQAVWRTCDRIWTALGDTSDDINWYTKRATLAGVYSTTVLYWLGDNSEGHTLTWAFLDRRIEDVMQIERLKARARGNRLVTRVIEGPLAPLVRVRPPRTGMSGMPGRWKRRA